MQAANVLFVDNPVGTGYSYCDTDAAFTTNVDQIAIDLVILFTAFLEKFPIFEVQYDYRGCKTVGALNPFKKYESPKYFYIMSQDTLHCTHVLHVHVSVCTCL